jgi:hypothetical protein
MPKRTPPPPTPQPPISTVSATLRIPGSELISLLNDRTRSQLARVNDAQANCLLGKCQIDLVAVRTGDITGEAVGSGMHLSLPFALRARLDLNSSLFKTGGEATAQGLADATTQISLLPDWRIEPNTQGRVQLSNAKLRLGPISMSVGELWNHNQQQLSGAIFRAVDKRIAAAIKLRGNAERLWRKVQQPIHVGRKPEAWLLLSPERLRVTPVHTENGNLVIALAADVRAHVLVGPRPEGPEAVPKLPPAQTLEAPSNAFAISVPVLLPYREAARLAIVRLKRKPIYAGTSQVLIDKLQILPSRDDVIVQAHFCMRQSWDLLGLFDSCGEGFLRGVPQYDPRSGKIRVVHVQLDIATYNLLLNAVRGIAGDAIAKVVEQHLVFDESGQIAKLKNEIRVALAKPQGKGVAITGQIKSFGNPTLHWTRDGFIALFTASGTLSANLNVKGTPT